MLKIHEYVRVGLGVTLALLVALWATPMRVMADEPCEGCYCNCEFDPDVDDQPPDVRVPEIPPPPPPPPANDRTFVLELPGTGSHICWGEDQPTKAVSFDSVTRYVGPTNSDYTLRNVDSLINKERIGSCARVTIMAWDIDSAGSYCLPPERTRVSLYPQGNG